MTFEEHGEGIGRAWTVLRENAARAGLDATVPTCPGWTVRDLVAHQGMVHRWATSVVLAHAKGDTAGVEQEGRSSGDLLGWLDRGATALLAALAFAPDDLQVYFFLKDAPPPKRAWARRQCHETTIHAVDAMSAGLGRPPSARQTWIGPQHAVDGIDELLCGFVPRRNERLRSTEPRTVMVQATDTGSSWTLEIGSGPVVTTAHAPQRRARAARDETTVITGTAAQLYLGLWNRGDEMTSTGPDFLRSWRQNMTVTWS
jgi:uncharacterized protein (TIGR03083 family)